MWYVPLGFMITFVVAALCSLCFGLQNPEVSVSPNLITPTLRRIIFEPSRRDKQAVTANLKDTAIWLKNSFITHSFIREIIIRNDLVHACSSMFSYVSCREISFLYCLKTSCLCNCFAFCSIDVRLNCLSASSCSGYVIDSSLDVFDHLVTQTSPDVLFFLVSFDETCLVQNPAYSIGLVHTLHVPSFDLLMP